MRIAIVGAGVAGLVSAHLLHGEHDVTLFDADERAGGHAQTLIVDLENGPTPVDVGFIVYNERNYPLLTSLFSRLGVVTRESDRSFAYADDVADVEWCGSSLTSLFAQPRNLLRPAFWSMLRDVTRFHRLAREALEAEHDLDESLGDFLTRGGFGDPFRSWYLVPMGAAIWSSSPERMLDFPATAFLRFFDNHGLLGLGDRPQWRTLVGGSRTYVEALTRPLGDRLRLSTPVRRVVRHDLHVEVHTDTGVELFDHVVLACHSDQALAMLDEPTDVEREVLAAIEYRPNSAVLHRDERFLPRRGRARASWNWRRRPDVAGPSVTYDLGRLQGLDVTRPVLLTLNPPAGDEPRDVLARLEFSHPVFDAASLRAQRRHAEIDGTEKVSFAGSYWGYGFHEDGARSAYQACRRLGVRGLEGVS